jgi:hypothetical protein
VIGVNLPVHSTSRLPPKHRGAILWAAFIWRIAAPSAKHDLRPQLELDAREARSQLQIAGAQQTKLFFASGKHRQ